MSVVQQRTNKPDAAGEQPHSEFGSYSRCERRPDAMSRSSWRCRNRECPVPHGAVLGWVTADGGLALQFEAATFVAHLDTNRVSVTCHACGDVREFRSSSL